MRKHFNSLARLAHITFVFSLLAGGAAQAGSVTVTDGWIRALPSKAPAGGYFTLSNDSGRHMVLNGASSPVCGMLMLHKTDTASGMASMNDVTEIPIAVGAHLSFAPGGYHLMCMNSTPALKPGASVPVTLLFKSGEKLTAQFAVRNAAGK